MRINLLSSFAAGILISTAICGTVYLYGKSHDSNASANTNGTPKTVSVQLSQNEMKNRLTSVGYVVQTKEEYEKNMKSVKQSGKSNTPKDNKQNPPVTKVFLNVTDGMTSIDVGYLLKDANLIPDAFKFSQDIQNKGVENNLRPGTYTVTSQMSYDQLISTIFK